MVKADAVVVLVFIVGSLLHDSLRLSALLDDHSHALRQLDSLDVVFVDIV